MEFSDEIIASLRRALADAPDNAHLHRHLADLLLAHSSPEDAIVAYHAALKLRPHDSHIQMGLAESYLKAHKFSAAAVLLDECLKDPHADPRVHVLHARWLHAQGNINAAQEAYLRAVAVQPDLKDPDLDRHLFLQVSQEIQRQEAERVPALSPQSEALAPVLERPQGGFALIGGMDAIKREIALRIIQPLQHPALFEAYGKRPGGGLLLYGPPGCGKTHLARATAAEIEAGFISVGINDILEMWLGQSERNLHAIFEQARAQAPCVLFFDEVDALGASRSDMRQNAGRQLINQFLLELDGLNSENTGVLILAATNAPWHLDTAFRRPGRFDRILFVPPPDEAARRAILEIHLQGKPHQDLDLGAIAKKTKDFSGADLNALIELGLEDKLREAMLSGQVVPMQQKDLLKALKRLKPTTKEWFSTARNYALYANQSGFYDEILDYLNAR